MVQARFKDAALPAQRIVLAGGFVLAAIHKLGHWLSHEAIHFDVLFDTALAPEAELFRILLLDDIRRGVATVEIMQSTAIPNRWASLARTAQMRGLEIAAAPRNNSDYWQLIVAGPESFLQYEDEKPLGFESPEPFDAWTEALEHLLKLWI
jgi:hypothetical protein